MEKQKETKEDLFNKYILPKKRLIAYVCRKYASTEEERPEFYNDVLLNLYKGIETYDSQRPINPWLYTVIKNCFIEVLKRRQKFKYDSNVDIEDLEADPVNGSGTNHMEYHNYRKHFSDDILLALDTINPIYREAIIMQQCGYVLKEIATHLFLKNLIQSENEQLVKQYLSYGRKKLKELLSRDGKLLSPPVCKKPAVKRIKQPLNHEHMAKLKSELDTYISMSERDYLLLVEVHIMLTALKSSGLEKMSIYKAAKSIIDNQRVEIHLKPVHKRYK